MAGFSAGAAILAALVAAQGVIPSGFMWIVFFSFILVGLGVGLLTTDTLSAVETSFFIGLVAYFLGTLFFAAGSAWAGRLPWELIIGETLVGAFVGTIFGLVTGVITAGGAAMGSLVRHYRSSPEKSF